MSAPDQAAPISTDDLRKLVAEATPGPWRRRVTMYDDEDGVEIVGEGNFSVCSMSDFDETDEANARLIALVKQLAAEVLARVREGAAPSAPAEVEGLVLPEVYAACGRCEENGEDECVHRLHDLRHDGEMWSCEDCWNPDESDKWDDAPKLATALSAQQAEIERLQGERQALAEAICGGEDFPGLLAATSVDALVDTARKEHRCHHETIDARLKAEAAIAHLTAELAEAREKNGALIERAADIADTYRDSCTPGGMQAISDTIACSIRALDHDAIDALAALIKRVREEAFRNGHSRGRTGNFFNEDEGMANYLARLDQHKEEKA